MLPTIGLLIIGSAKGSSGRPEGRGTEGAPAQELSSISILDCPVLRSRRVPERSSTGKDGEEVLLARLGGTLLAFTLFPQPKRHAETTSQMRNTLNIYVRWC